MPFQIHALPEAAFAHLFDLSDRALRQENACRQVVTAHPGTPCRVSLADAELGEEVILVNYTHQPANTPYQSSHAIFVRAGVAQAKPAPGQVPDVFLSRLLSVRLFDAQHMMMDAEAVDGTELAHLLPRLFADARVAYIHLHFAKPGCFAARVTRVLAQV